MLWQLRKDNFWVKSMDITKLGRMYKSKFKSKRSFQDNFSLNIQLLCAVLNIKKQGLHMSE